MLNWYIIEESRGTEFIYNLRRPYATQEEADKDMAEIYGKMTLGDKKDLNDLYTAAWNADYDPYQDEDVDYRDPDQDGAFLVYRGEVEM